jgi:hypothetical protein
VRIVCACEALARCVGRRGGEHRAGRPRVGEPLSFRATPLAANPFVGVQAPAPPGGDPDVRCALNGTVGADGSITGSVVVPDANFSHPTVHESIFPRPGAWKCVARGVRRRQRRELRHRGVRHAVVRAADRRRAQRLPAAGRFGTFRGRFGAKRVRMRMRRPRAPGFYLGRFAFSGTRFLRAGADPNPMLLLVTKRRMGFADPRGFPHC